MEITLAGDTNYFKRGDIICIHHDNSELVLSKIKRINNNVVDVRKLYFYEKLWVRIKQYINQSLTQIGFIHNQ